MRVAYLYIIGIGLGMGPDEEASEVCDGLYTKYGGRSGPTALIGFDNDAKPQVLKKTGDIPINEGIPRAVSYSETQPPGVQIQARKGVGVYLAIHGTGASEFGLLEPTEVVDILVSIIPEAQRRNLDKIALIQCFGARKKYAELNGQLVQDIAKAPPLIQLLSALRDQGMRPMVAGWEGFVSVAPHRPKDQDDVDQEVKTKPANAAHWQVVADLATIAGRKIVKYAHTMAPLISRIEKKTNTTIRSMPRAGFGWISKVGPIND